jgi:serine/threonine-protein kinase RsbW
MSEAFLQATTRDPGHLELLKELELSSYMAVPLVAGNQILGAVTLVSTGARRYSPDDLALAEDLARRVALVVAKERRFDRERSSSHALQTSLLPHRLPAVAGVEVAVRYLPGTKDAEVGGDFWDVVALPTGEVALMVGDVAGHDMTAAATMAQIRAACRAWRAHTTGPADLISVIQDGWHQLDLDRIATAVFARLHPGSGRLRIASAGHPLPLIIAESTASFVEVQCAPPFGAPARRPDTWEAILPAGGMVLFFTDGLVEDRHRQIDEGLRQLMKAATSSPLLEPEALADHVLATVSGDERSDDIALVIVRRKPAGRSPDQPVGQRMPAGGMPDLPFRLC